MTNEDVAFLDTWSRVARNTEHDVAEVPHLAAVGTGEADYHHAFAACGLNRPQNIRAIATR